MVPGSLYFGIEPIGIGNDFKMRICISDYSNLGILSGARFPALAILIEGLGSKVWDSVFRSQGISNPKP